MRTLCMRAKRAGRRNTASEASCASRTHKVRSTAEIGGRGIPREYTSVDVLSGFPLCQQKSFRARRNITLRILQSVFRNFTNTYHLYQYTYHL